MALAPSPACPPTTEEATRAGGPDLGHGGVGDRSPVSSPWTRSARWRRRLLDGTTFTSASSASICSTASRLARIDVAIEALTVEICRPPKPSWISTMRSTPAAARSARGARSGKLSAAERSALNQALAKALAFRDAGRVPEAREWAAELVKLLNVNSSLRLFRAFPADWRPRWRRGRGRDDTRTRPYPDPRANHADGSDPDRRDRKSAPTSSPLALLPH